MYACFLINKIHKMVCTLSNINWQFNITWCILDG